MGTMLIDEERSARTELKVGKVPPPHFPVMLLLTFLDERMII